METEDLVRVARVGDLARVKYLVGQRKDLDTGDALRWAALGGYLEVVRYLVEKCNSDVNAKDEHGAAAVVWAASSGKVKVVQYIAEQCDVDINAKSESGYTAFLVAAQWGHYDVVQFLCEQCDANVKCRNENESTALMLAAVGGHTDVARYLVEQCGLDLNAENIHGLNALMGGVLSGGTEIVRYLVKEQGADVNAKDAKGNTVLMGAILEDNVEMVCCLAEQCDADVNVKNATGSTALMEAAARGNAEIVQYLVERWGTGVDEKNTSGVTALMCAAKYGHIEVVQYLSEHCKADMNAANGVGATALMWAAAAGKATVVRYMIEQGGADVNATSKNGYTALMAAVEKKSLKVVQYLVEQCDIDLIARRTDDGFTALMLAARHGELELVQYIVEHGDAKDIGNDGALMWAASCGHLEIVRYLVEESGAEVSDFDVVAALTSAASQGNVDVVQYIVEEVGIDVNGKNKHGGSTALMWAAVNDMIDVVQYLVLHGGADVNTSNEIGATALFWAAEEGNIQVVKYLFEQCGTDGSAITTRGCTPLMGAAASGRIEVVQYLTEQCGVDLNTRNQMGDTALIMAAENDKIEIVKHLAGNRGADVNVVNIDGSTALLKAAEKGSLEIARFLAGKCGAHVNTKNRKGNTALLCAAQSNHPELARYLAEQCGANVNARNENSDTALMWAARNGSITLVRYLVEECAADVNIKNNKGETVVMWATTNGKVDVVRYFVELCDVDANAKSNDKSTALRIAADHGYHEIQQILTPFLVPALLSHSSDENDSANNTDLSFGNFKCGIPASEIKLGFFCQSSNIGGEFQAKWLDADVAVKLFIPDASHSSFENEMLSWQRLRHPNVLRIYGACKAARCLHFFVCEYASCGSLLDHVYSSSLKNPIVWKYLHEAALGLEYLHERGIIHGEIRCSNILIGCDGLAKLSSFGFSDPIRRPRQDIQRVIGSSRWQAPEVLRGEKPSRESDVYSLGLSILEAVAGNIPWGDYDDSDENWSTLFNKNNWVPEIDGDYSWYQPHCPPGDARELVWRMCSQDPQKRACLASVVYQLQYLAFKGCNQKSQPEAEPVITFDEYTNGKMHVWQKLEAYMKNCADPKYCRAFHQLSRIYERLRDSTHETTVFERFDTLVTDLYKITQMSPKQMLCMRLSSTRATTNSLYAFQWRMQSLVESLEGMELFPMETEAQWKQERTEQTLFVSGVSDIFLLLKDLESGEERSAFLRALKTEIEVSVGKYTSEEFAVMHSAYENISSTVENSDELKPAPEWFIPWYELIVDNWSCVGEGGFGRVHRAKWLNSEVVVKQVMLGGLAPNMHASDQISWLASDDPSATAAEMNATKREEALTMFRREVEIWFGLSHPHVVRLFGACHVGNPFFVCEYATNGTLVNFLRGHPDELWSKLHEAASGVQYLHARDVVHGDLKGNNIMIGSDMKAKVTDFGLSSIASNKEETKVSGAWNWLAPELLDTNQHPTFASDVYSLGMCIVEALRVVESVKFGKTSCIFLPWRVADKVAMKYHAMRGTLPSQPAICEDDQWDLVKRMCVLEPEKRIKISTVVDELAMLAKGTREPNTATVNSLSVTVNWESIPDVIRSTYALLNSLQGNNAQRCDLLSQYASLWQKFEQVRRWINDSQNNECHDGFCSLVASFRVATKKLQERDSSLISLAETTMRCYALQRSLERFCEAYFLVHGVPSFASE
ncbi:unnamed protein product [Phytophthora fragariaefolia]|uniref:Unnamed protein product n=1 Tax=Phytophthora fragariaefolia TaxID=1490495 RepID=A0A9W6TWZ6_9STRA|nr:unnamed protein product [Phytophthora fragariaefolia]